jgi:glucuronoarabinoxylan endo-1,4-beta-xylanase
MLFFNFVLGALRIYGKMENMFYPGYLFRVVTLGLSIAAITSFSVSASVTVTVNLGTNWVGFPTVMVTNYPAINLNGAEGNWGSGTLSLGQSFTAPVSGTLINVQTYARGFNNTNVLFLYDLGPAIQYALGPSATIIPGSNGVSGNLLSSNLSVFVTNMPNPSVIRFDLSGADSIQLTGGHQYLFNLGLNAGNQMYWYRNGGGTDVYSGGAAYRQTGLLNSSKTTDFSLAVTLINTSAPPPIYNCVVDKSTMYQRIDGFGACSAWQSTWRNDLADMFFGTNSGVCSTLNQNSNFPYTGIGLSLLRTRIAPGGSTWENSIMQMAQARGARVWSTPWSPQASFKSNNNINGGNFVSANYQAYAAQLAGYIVNMFNSYGVNIYALSIQNEPALATSYESCVWTPQQIHDFVPYLVSAMSASNVASTKIVLAEDEHWRTNYFAPSMMDSAVATNIAVIACHNYDNSPPNNIPENFPRYANTNAVLWETEVSKLAGNGAFDPGMGDGMYWAGRLHLFMTQAQVSAWHYWWLISANPDNEGLTDTNAIPAKRMYVLGQYSRFVRPDFYRMGLNNYNPYAVLASAYSDSKSGKFAIVVANTNANDVFQSFSFTNLETTLVTPWITSSNYSLTAQPSIAVTNSVFTYTIPGMSVVTFEGTAIDSKPSLDFQISESDLIISWPTSVIGFSLEYSTDISFSNWTSAVPFGITGDRYTFTNSNSEPVRFFRLKKVQ